jgi:Mg2+-importing ATPase
VRRVTRELNREGLRVVAVAMKEVPPPRALRRGRRVGADPDRLRRLPRPAQGIHRQALAALAAHGVAVKVLTGDNELVAAKVCREVGLPVDRAAGQQIERMDDERCAAVEQHQLFAKLTPLHKERIVRARANGHVTGFMGDGINDARRCARPTSASAWTAPWTSPRRRPTSSCWKKPDGAGAGRDRGPAHLRNMLKYIRMTASSNFGNVFSVLVASAFIPFLPMLPLHLLVQNLLYDLSQIAIPFDNVDEELVRQPLRWNPADLGRFMLFFGPISSLFDILTFALMWFVFAPTRPSSRRCSSRAGSWSGC